MRRLLSAVSALVLLAALPVVVPLAASPPVAEASAAVDEVDVSLYRQLTPDVAGVALAAATKAGGQGAVVRGGTLRMESVWRGSAAVQRAPKRYAYGMSSAAIDPAAARALEGDAVANALASGTVVMGATTASLRGARAGDQIQVVGWNNMRTRLVIGLVAPDDQVGAELLLSNPTADALGFTRWSYIRLWGFTSRQAIDDAVVAAGLVRDGVRVRRSWDPPDPDATLSTARVKAVAGEFVYRLSGQSLSPDARWVARALPRRRVVLNATIPVAARCNHAIETALRGALADVAVSGLGAAVDVRNTNRYGGCYGPRLVRPFGGTTGGQVSRHAWGIAFDMNTAANAMGAVPALDCRVVRIFRKWGFAWGGNFLSPDGMHFEYVGERRDTWAYPSRFCPNETAQAPGAILAPWVPVQPEPATPAPVGGGAPADGSTEPASQ